MRLITIDEWMDFLRGAELFAGDLTERKATLCFSWSRSIVEDETTAKGYIRDTCLPFEGFLEALCRLSVMAPLPSDEELKAAGFGPTADCASRAGAYLTKLRLDHEDQYHELCKLESAEWGDEPQRMPIQRRVDHLLSIIWYALARQREAATGYGLRLTKECSGTDPEVLDELDKMLL